MEPEPQHPAVPADSDGAGAELLPHLVGHDRRVLKHEPGAVRIDCGEADLDHRHVRLALGLPVVPRHLEAVWSLALADLAARVALELEPPAEPEVPAHRQEPAADAPR